MGVTLKVNGKDISQMSKAELVAALETERQKAQRTLRIKVSDKRAVSVYGIRRFPVTFYAQEWEKILGEAENIGKFISENSSELAWK